MILYTEWWEWITVEHFNRSSSTKPPPSQLLGTRELVKLTLKTLEPEATFVDASTLMLIFKNLSLDFCLVAIQQ